MQTPIKAFREEVMQINNKIMENIPVKIIFLSNDFVLFSKRKAITKGNTKVNQIPA